MVFFESPIQYNGEQREISQSTIYTSSALKDCGFTYTDTILTQFGVTGTLKTNWWYFMSIAYAAMSDNNENCSDPTLAYSSFGRYLDLGQWPY